MMNEEQQEFDSTNAVSNPYIESLKQINADLTDEIINYLKRQSKITGIPYQILIKFYLLRRGSEFKKE